jgi:hypothetical protein
MFGSQTLPDTQIACRIPETQKIIFRTALMRRRLKLQNTIEAFVELFNRWDNDDLDPKEDKGTIAAMERIAARSDQLNKGL